MLAISGCLITNVLHVFGAMYSRNHLNLFINILLTLKDCPVKSGDLVIMLRNEKIRAICARLKAGNASKDIIAANGCNLPRDRTATSDQADRSLEHCVVQLLLQDKFVPSTDVDNTMDDGQSPIASQRVKWVAVSKLASTAPSSPPFAVPYTSTSSASTSPASNPSTPSPPASSSHSPAVRTAIDLRDDTTPDHTVAASSSSSSSMFRPPAAKKQKMTALQDCAAKPATCGFHSVSIIKCSAITFKQFKHSSRQMLRAECGEVEYDIKQVKDGECMDQRIASFPSEMTVLSAVSSAHIRLVGAEMWAPPILGYTIVYAQGGYQLGGIAMIANPGITLLDMLTQPASSSMSDNEGGQSESQKNLSSLLSYPLTERLMLAIMVAQTVKKMRHANIEHRDLSPSIIKVTLSNERIASQMPSQSPTPFGQVVITDYQYSVVMNPNTAAPMDPSQREQHAEMMYRERNASEQGPSTLRDCTRDDLFAVGIIIFNIICGRSSILIGDNQSDPARFLAQMKALLAASEYRDAPPSLVLACMCDPNAGFAGEIKTFMQKPDSVKLRELLVAATSTNCRAPADTIASSTSCIESLDALIKAIVRSRLAA